MERYIVENINNYTYDFLASKVTKDRIEKASKYRYDVDKMRSLTVEYALNKLIKSEFPDIILPVMLTYDTFGKPSLTNNISNSEIYISLSHAGDYAVAMICDKPCGIDIESTDRNIEKIAKRFFSKEELESITCDDDYFKIWTCKESILKATGKGLAMGIDTFSINNNKCVVNNNTYLCKQIMSPDGYVISYAVLE